MGKNMDHRDIAYLERYAHESCSPDSVAPDDGHMK